MSASVSLVDLRQVFHDSRKKKDVVAVERFNLNVKPGHLVTLLGPSGCGKTTVLRMLAGFERPTSGQVFIDGVDHTSTPANKRNSAMVFQSYALFPHLSVSENIKYGLKFKKMTKAEKDTRFDEIVTAVNLQGYEDRWPHELSGGQQQRVALARALITHPALLLLDEPLSNLDAKLRESMRNEIRRLQQMLNITALYVTHDQSEAMAISDRVVVMSKGKMEQLGSPTDIYLKPVNRFVADFMGAANFLKAELREVSGGSSSISWAGNTFRVPHTVNCSGSEVLIVVRPEGVVLRAPQPNHPGAKGRIAASYYLGSNFEYQVSLENGELLTAHSNVTTTQPSLFKTGDLVEVSLREDNLHLLAP